jgi:hypothetical protein
MQKLLLYKYILDHYQVYINLQGPHSFPLENWNGIDPLSVFPDVHHSTVSEQDSLGNVVVPGCMKIKFLTESL